MFSPTFKSRSVIGAGVIAAVALMTGCGDSATESSPASSKPSTVRTSIPPQTASPECAQAIAAIEKASAGGELSTEQLDALAFAGPKSCRDLADLRSALNDQFDPGTGTFLTDFVISSCVTGDAWALLGDPSINADTALCKEARRQYTVGGGRRLIAAHATFEDSFNGPCRGWSTDQDARVTLSCVDGAYRVLVRQPGRPQHSRLFDVDGRPQLSIEADAVLMKPRKGEFEGHGVTCWSTRSLGYLFVLTPDGTYAIIKGDVASGAVRFLKEGKADYALPGVGARNRIRGDCEVADGVARLAFYVNGERVGVARDKAAGNSFNGYGLVVATSERNTDVRFDNVLVRGGES
jgi:hypothetical protein